MASTRSRRRRRLLPLALVLVPLLVLAFKLFEPVFVHGLGWETLPDVAWPVAQELDDPGRAAQAAEARQHLEAARKRLDAPALSAAVSIDGKTVWRAAVGYADLDTRQQVTLQTRFRLGSTSKAVTAVAVGTLLDRGAIELDAPIQHYVPLFPQKPWPVSLRQVMSHRAGLRDYGMCACFPVWEQLNRRHFENVDASVAVIARDDLLFEPSTAFRYTSLGYNLAGAAVERAGGKPFGQYLADAVFVPLGMTASGLDAVPGAGTDAATYYEVEGGRFKPAFAVDNSIRWPSGGMLSTPSDMVRLGGAMLEGGMLSAPTRQALTTVPAGGSSSRGGKIYALGWRAGDWLLFDGKVKAMAYTHAGTAVGSTSVFAVFPEQRIVVSLMMNKGGQNVDDLSAVADQVLQAFWAKAP